MKKILEIIPKKNIKNINNNDKNFKNAFNVRNKSFNKKRSCKNLRDKNLSINKNNSKQKININLFYNSFLNKKF
jgi:hypothetical protein